MSGVGKIGFGKQFSDTWSNRAAASNIGSSDSFSFAHWTKSPNNISRISIFPFIWGLCPIPQKSTIPKRGPATMADTVRTLAQLQALLADNIAGDITPQKLRDFLVSIYAHAGDLSSLNGALDNTDLVAAVNSAYAAAAILPGGIFGLTVSNNATDATNDLDIAAGQAVDNLGAKLTLASGLTKQLDATWAAGTNQGMRTSSVSIADGTWHIFQVDIGGTIDILADTSITCANGVTDHSVLSYRRISSWRRVSGVLQQIYQFGDEFWFKDVQVPVSATQIDTAGALYTLSHPTGIQAIAFGVVNGGQAASAGSLSVSMTTPGGNYQTPAGDPTSDSFRGIVGNYYNSTGPDVRSSTSYWRVLSNTSAQIGMKRLGTYLGSGSYTTVQQWGWIDYRGRMQ